MKVPRVFWGQHETVIAVHSVGPRCLDQLELDPGQKGSKFEMSCLGYEGGDDKNYPTFVHE